MECCIIGAGAIGIALGAALLQSGAGVAYVARGETKEAIDQAGIHRIGLFGTLDFGPGAARTYESCDSLPEGAFDFVIITAKTMANDAISQELGRRRDVFRPGGKLLIVQNGWGNDAPYLRFFPKEQVYSARIITGFRRVERNLSQVTVHTQPMLLGSLYGCPETPMEPLAKAICQAGPPCETTMEVGKALWAKMLYNCTLNPLGAILRLPYGALTETPETVSIMNDLIDEIFAVMQAAGYETFWPNPDAYRDIFYSKLVPDTYDHRSSTLQDIERKQKTEIETLTGRILALGKAHHVPVPCNTVIYRMIRGLEQNF